MPQILVPYKDYVPDQPDLTDQGLTVCTNALPVKNGYKPMQEPEVFSSNALDATPLGMASFKKASGDIVTFAADDAKIYKLSGTTFGDASKSGGYSTGGKDVVRFIAWGNEFVFSTNNSDPIQLFQIGTDTEFSDVSPTAPVCKDMAVVNNFLVTVHTTESDGVHENRVRWSPIGNPEGEWGSKPETQTDFQDLQTGVFAVGISGGEYGIILCDNAIYRMTFIGSPATFQFEEVETDVGLIGLTAFASFGRNIYYLSDNGFFVFNGSESVSIGNSRVDEFFQGDSDKSFHYKIQCSVNPRENVVMWSYVSTSTATTGIQDKVLIYNYVLNKWSSAAIEAVIFNNLKEGGLTLEELDPFSTPINDIDNLPASLDDERWRGGDDVFGLFRSDNKLYYFTGDNLDATFETGDLNLNQNGTTLINRARPIRDGGTATVAIAGRQKQDDTVTYGSAASETAIGDMSIRSNARYQRIKTIVTGQGWNQIQAVSVDFKEGGFR